MLPFETRSKKPISPSEKEVPPISEVDYHDSLTIFSNEVDLRKLRHSNDNGDEVWEQYRDRFTIYKGTPLTCSHCLNHRTDTCIQEPSDLILPTAVFARTCEAFKSRTLTVAKGKPIVRYEFTRGTEQDFVKLSMKILGLSEYAAKGWFQQLVETGELGYDDEGLYGWMEKPETANNLSRGARLKTLGDER